MDHGRGRDLRLICSLRHQALTLFRALALRFLPPPSPPLALLRAVIRESRLCAARLLFLLALLCGSAVSRAGRHARASATAATFAADAVLAGDTFDARIDE